MKRPDKMMSDLQRLLKTQNFQSKKELEAFMNNLVGQSIPEFEKEALSLEEQAEELVTEAHELDMEQAMINILHALELDPDCIPAYEFLGALQPVPQLALPYYAYGVQVGRKKFERELKEERGHFWLIFETRPFIQILGNYASSLFALGKDVESMNAFREILELNTSDNMGVRYHFGLCLLENRLFDEFLQLDMKFNHEESSMMAFTRLLHSFMVKGEVKETVELNKAKKLNKNMIAVLTSKNSPRKIPSFYSPGSKDEALTYAGFGYEVWQKTKGAIAFLLKHKK
jgi:tetratricopeptide (TPR) repeat protein